MAKYTKEYPLRKVVVGPSDATTTPAQFNEQVVNNDGSTNVVLANSNVTLDTALKNVEGTPNQAAPAKGAVTGGVYLATPPSLTDGQMARTQMDPKGNTLVGLRSSSNVEPTILSWGDADANPINYKGFFNAAALMGFNSTNWDRWRNNTEGTLLASAARTSVANSPDQTNYNARGVLIYLNVTAASGTGGIQVRIQPKDPLSGGYMGGMNAAPVAVTATGLYTYLIYPGIGTPNATQATSGTVPRTWRVQVLHADGSSYTYSVGYQYIV